MSEVLQGRAAAPPHPVAPALWLGWSLHSSCLICGSAQQQEVSGVAKALGTGLPGQLQRASTNPTVRHCQEHGTDTDPLGLSLSLP